MNKIRKNIFPALAMTGFLAAGGVTTSHATPEPDEPIVRVSDTGGEVQIHVYRREASGRDGVIGMSLRGSPDGVRVIAVTPGGAAERAGVQSGDIVRALNGRKITEAADVLGLMTPVESGDKIAVELQRDGRDLSVEIVAQSPGQPASNESEDEPAIRIFTRPGAGGFAYRVVEDIDLEELIRQLGESRGRGISTPISALQLATLGPDLGSYFGTDHGVVLLAPEDVLLPGLRAGDVILRIDDTPTLRSEDVVRKLRVASGVRVVVRVLRHGVEHDVAVEVPDLSTSSAPTRE